MPLLAVPGKAAFAGLFESGLSCFAYGFSSSFVFVVGCHISDAGMQSDRIPELAGDGQFGAQRARNLGLVDPDRAGIGAAEAHRIGDRRQRLEIADNSQQVEDLIDDLGITSREIQILKLLAQGFNNVEISKTLGITETTVKTHMAKIFVKLSVRDRVQALIAAARLGIVEIPKD